MVLERRVADLDAQPLAAGDLGAEPHELAAELLLGVAACGLLQRLQAHHHTTHWSSLRIQPWQLMMA